MQRVAGRAGIEGHLLESHQIGVQRLQHAGNALRIGDAVAADAAVDVIGGDAQSHALPPSGRYRGTLALEPAPQSHQSEAHQDDGPQQKGYLFKLGIAQGGGDAIRQQDHRDDPGQ